MAHKLMKATLRPSAATPPHTTNCDKQSQSGPDHALGKEHATLEKLLHLGCGSPQVWAQHGRCALNLSFVVKHGRGVTTFRMVDYRYEERCDECMRKLMLRYTPCARMLSLCMVRHLHSA